MAGSNRLIGSQPSLIVNIGSQPFLIVNIGSQPSLIVNIGSQPFLIVNIGLQPFLIVNIGLQPFLIVNIGSRTAIHKQEPDVLIKVTDRDDEYCQSILEQELLTLPEHMRSLPVFSVIRVAQS